MCGISGFSWEDKELVKSMISLISHRGPDQKGVFTDNGVSLGHARLSIIDLSEKGKQPMTNEDGNIIVTYNGEIYNFKEIKEKLEMKGHTFRSDTDSEIIVHAYEEYGEKCVSLFEGMFAFALWDSDKKLFFLARDRAGIKPLYYSTKDNNLIFASEIKAILLHKNINRDVDNRALYNFLTFRYTPGIDSIFSDVKKLMPGHYLIYKDNKISIKKYWDLEFNIVKKSYSKRLHNELKESVKKRLISDVPLGAFLSGGLDSSYIVGLMSELSDQPAKTFSIGFHHGYDESKFSRMVSEHYGTDHKEIFLEEKSFELLPKILWHMDEPIADFASIPTYVLSEFAKKKVSVVLTGEGADEIFGGYRKYKYIQACHPYFKVPHKIRSLLSNVLGNSVMQKRIKEFSTSKSIPESYLNLISFFTKSEKEKLGLVDESRPDIKTIEPYFLKKSMLNSLMNIDFKTWLPEDLLMKVDKTTMAHALEARVPFLDHHVVELASQMPPQIKMRFYKEKYILRKAMKETVPKVISKRKKHGFNVPIHSWLDNELKDVSLQLLSKESVNKRGFFKYDYIEKLFNNYKKSKIYYSRQLWMLLNFEIWARIYIDGNKNLTL